MIMTSQLFFQDYFANICYYVITAKVQTAKYLMDCLRKTLGFGSSNVWVRLPFCKMHLVNYKDAYSNSCKRSWELIYYKRVTAIAAYSLSACLIGILL